jgi:hypothetical protein
MLDPAIRIRRSANIEALDLPVETERQTGVIVL